MQNVKSITTAQLTQLLLNRHTPGKMAVFAGLKIKTDARLKKTNNPWPNVQKVSEMTVMLNTEYVSGVHNQLKREDKPTSEYRAGENSMPLVFGENNHIVGFFNGEAVLQFRPFDKSHPVVTYLTDEGFEVAKADVEPFLPSKKKADNQGTDKEILWRKVYLRNVTEMTIDGTKYAVANK